MSVKSIVVKIDEAIVLSSLLALVLQFYHEDRGYGGLAQQIYLVSHSLYDIGEYLFLIVRERK